MFSLGGGDRNATYNVVNVVNILLFNEKQRVFFFQFSLLFRNEISRLSPHIYRSKSCFNNLDS